MGIFSRIGKMTQAKINNAIDEMENPIELLDQKLRDMEKSLNDAKIASAQVLGSFKQTERKMKEALAESVEWDEKVKLAMSKGNEDLAKRALAKKLDCDKSYEVFKTTYEAEKIKADHLKKKLVELEAEVDKTRSYRDEAVARLTSAEAGVKVNEILANVSTKSGAINMDSIERKIAKKENLAEGLGEIAEVDTLDSEFEALGNPDLDAELEKYRK
ncbi:MAG: PspA/IM30 family protein [Clostridiaceae bacterium]|nr:PspA/IM30 family protein [Clostridiaceae bacterium]